MVNTKSIIIESNLRTFMEIMWKEVNIIICTFFQKANEKDETMFKLAKPLSILVGNHALCHQQEH